MLGGRGLARSSARREDGAGLRVRGRFGDTAGHREPGGGRGGTGDPAVPASRTTDRGAAGAGTHPPAG